MTINELALRVAELQSKGLGRQLVLVPPPQDAWPPMPIKLRHLHEWKINDQIYVLLIGNDPDKPAPLKLKD